MPSSNQRITILCLLAIIPLAGCGGSSNSSSSGGGGGGGETSTTVTYTFKVATPSAVAVQMGTGAYQAATLESSILTLSIPAGTTNYSVAYACPGVTIGGVTSNEEFIFERSTLDGTSFAEGCFSPTASQVGTVSVQVDPSAIPGTAFVGISGNGFAPEPWSGGSLTLTTQLAVGTSDVFVVAYDSTGQYPLAVRILRSQTIPGALNGGNPLVFTVADETSKQNITYTGIPAGFAAAPPLVTFYTSSGAYLQLGTDTLAIPAQYPALPAAALQSGDYYTFLASASAGGIGGSLAVESATSTGGPQALTFPSTPWSYAGPTAAVLPTFNFNYAGFSGSQNTLDLALLEWTLGITQANPFGTTFDSIEISASGNYQSGSTAITIPDLSSLTGFLPSPPANTAVDWSAGITQGTGFQTNPPTGTVQNVSNNGTYVVP